MYMKGENLDSLVNLMNLVISRDGHGSVMTISNPQYNEMYLKIFLDEIELNNNEPIPYEAFGDRLWIKLNKDVNSFAKEADEFMEAWNRWVDLFRYLKKNNKIR